MPTVHPQVQKARDLAPMLAAAGDTNDEIRELTKPVVAALIDGGFFHMLKARSVGGMELKPSIFAQVTEAIAAGGRLDRAGWCVRVTVARPPAPIWNRRWRRKSSARRTAFSPGGRLARTRRSRSTAAIASPAPGGSPAAVRMRHIWARICAIKGTGELRSFLFPKSSAQNERHLAHASACAAPPATNTPSTTCSCRRNARCTATTRATGESDGLVYRFTSNQLYSIGFGGVGLGIARGMIDCLSDAAGHQESPAAPANRCGRITSSSRSSPSARRAGSRRG